MPYRSTKRVAVLSGARQRYIQKIFSAIPGIYALYPLNETSGITAYDVINGYNATLNGPTLGAIAGPGASMGNAAFYDGAVDYAQLPAASLDGPFDPNLGTLLIWLKVANAGVWTDGADRFGVSLGANGSNCIFIRKSATANTLRFDFVAGGSPATTNVAYSATDWFCAAVTWNLTSNRIRHYLNGSQAAPDAAYPGAWSGSLANTRSQICATLGASFWHGYPSFLVLSNQEASAAQIAAASVAS